MAYSSREDQLKAEKRFRDNHKKAGFCTRCNNKAKDGLKLCQYHIDYAAKANSKQPIEKRRSAVNKSVRKLKEEILNHYGRRCACCGESHVEFLTVDHVEGNGSDHRRLGIRGGGSILRWLKANRFPEGFRILCANCNMAMGIYGLCPHGNLPPQSTKHPANKFKNVEEDRTRSEKIICGLKLVNQRNEGYTALTEAAQIYNFPYSRIWRKIVSGDFPATKIGNRWFVKNEDLELIDKI